VSLRFLDLIFERLLNWLLLLGRTSSSTDIELFVLRDEIAILRRTNPTPLWGSISRPEAVTCGDRRSALQT
jgi:hypothetical protein